MLLLLFYFRLHLLICLNFIYDFDSFYIHVIICAFILVLLSWFNFIRLCCLALFYLIYIYIWPFSRFDLHHIHMGLVQLWSVWILILVKLLLDQYADIYVTPFGLALVPFNSHIYNHDPVSFGWSDIYVTLFGSAWFRSIHIYWTVSQFHLD